MLPILGKIVVFDRHFNKCGSLVNLLSYSFWNFGQVLFLVSKNVERYPTLTSSDGLCWTKHMFFQNVWGMFKCYPVYFLPTVSQHVPLYWFCPRARSILRKLWNLMYSPESHVLARMNGHWLYSAVLGSIMLGSDCRIILSDKMSDRWR